MSITLLNGDIWQEKDLLKKMDDDNFYYQQLGVDKVLSQSSLSDILDCPDDFYKSLAKIPKELNENYRAGTLLHMLYLEPKKFYKLNFIEADRTNAKAYKEAVEKYGEDNVYKVKEQMYTESLVDVLNNKERLMQIRKNCEVEVPAVKVLSGIPIRGKADILTDNVIYDVKTTRVNPDKFNWWKVTDYNYDLQAYLYCQLFEKDYFAFITINKGNKSVGIRHCSQEVIDSGKAKFLQAINKYKTKFMGKSLDEIKDELTKDIHEGIIRKPGVK